MPVTPASLRALYPEFAVGAYPDAVIMPWIPIAERFVAVDRWGTLSDLGVTLWICHQITLSRQAAKQAAFGAIPGQTKGIVTSKSVDGVSVSSDVSSATESDAGHWNLTVYGTQFYRLLRMMGAGGIYLGAPDGSGPGSPTAPFAG